MLQVFLAALTGYVPDEIIESIRAFIDFAYYARRSSHDTTSLEVMEALLEQYHHLREVFVEVGVRPDGFTLPRQHALVHYIHGIRQFGALNGLCTSITENKHIHAVKRLWRVSSRDKALLQILVRNTRNSQLAALRVEFGRRGMLAEDIVQWAKHKVSLSSSCTT